MAVGFWNFVGAGIFGFLINLPIISYFETGTLPTINHGHAAMMGVFGMLGIGLIVFVIRQAVDESQWHDLEKLHPVQGLSCRPALTYRMKRCGNASFKKKSGRRPS